MKVLVAEDEHLARLLLTAAVGGLGHECLAAEDGEQAWELYRQNRPDVLITDWLMPGMDGVELCRRVRSDPGPDYTYVIVLTTRAARDDLVAGMEAGADDYMTKPLDPLELKARFTAAERVTSLRASRARTDGGSTDDASMRWTTASGDRRDDETARRLRLLHDAVSRLAAPGGNQLIELDGTHPDEFALTFYEGFALLAALRGEGVAFSREALYALNRIDDLLHSMSNEGHADLWSSEAMRTHPSWEEVRGLAREALACLPKPSQLTRVSS